MLKILSQPYPHGAYTTQRLLITALGAGVFVALFLILFQPFGSQQWESPFKSLYLWGYGGVTTVILLFISFVIPQFFRNWFAEKNWTVGKEILLLILIIFCISQGNFLYSSLIFKDTHFTLETFLGWLYATAAIGIFPSIMMALLNYNYQLRKYTRDHFRITAPSEAEKNIESILEIELLAENEKDRLKIPAADLLYIESADNYSEVVFLRNGKVLKELIRSSLSRLEGQIAVDFVRRCHRSYIVNLHQVASVSGNAQGYKLHLRDLSEPVPVARKYSEEVVLKRFKKA